MLINKLKLNGKSIHTQSLQPNVAELATLYQHLDSNPQVFIGGIDDLVGLEEIIQQYQKISPEQNAAFYLIYPKKSVLNKSYIGRDELWKAAQHYGFEANKLVSVNDAYSCMGFRTQSIMAKLRASRQVSQCVDDYIAHIPLILQELQPYPELLQFFEELSFGYQKDWARFVYSAVQDETRNTRLVILRDAISAGYKTHDLYKSAQKSSSI